MTGEMEMEQAVIRVGVEAVDKDRVGSDSNSLGHGAGTRMSTMLEK